VSSNRAESMRQGVEILERARAHPSLSADERSFVDRTLRVKRGEVRLALAEATLRRRDRDARRRALEVAFGELPPGYGLRTRVHALCATVAPRLAGRLLTRRARRGGLSMLHTETRGR
jgi:hypothetical protein